MDLRNKEDKLHEKLEHVGSSSEWKSKNGKINKILNDAVNEKTPIYFMTDIHLFIKNQSGKGGHPAYNMQERINALKSLPENSVFVFLGDLTDGEFVDGNELLKVMNGVIKSKYKIMVVGNNDLMPRSVYNKIFDIVTTCFVWDNIMFSHMSQKHNNRMNIHGHMHNSRNYWNPYNNHIDIAFVGGRDKPVDLETIIKSLNRYKTQVREDPTKFTETANIIEYNLIDYIE